MNTPCQVPNVDDAHIKFKEDGFNTTDIAYGPHNAKIFRHYEETFALCSRHFQLLFIVYYHILSIPKRKESLQLFPNSLCQEITDSLVLEVKGGWAASTHNATVSHSNASLTPPNS